jgi:hypothetical protein
MDGVKAISRYPFSGYLSICGLLCFKEVEQSLRETHFIVVVPETSYICQIMRKLTAEMALDILTVMTRDLFDRGRLIRFSL